MEQAPWDENEQVRVRECSNGCKRVIYFNESLGKYCNLNDGQKHDCPNFKKGHGNSNNNNSSSAKSNNNNNNNTGSSSSSGNEVLLKGQLEELRRAVDHLSRIAMFVENIDFRVKKIEESLHYSSPPARPKLTDDSIDSDSEIIGGVQEQH